MARTAWLALLTLALAGFGCGQQDEPHTNTGPETNADSNVPTPATRPEPATTPATGPGAGSETTPAQPESVPAGEPSKSAESGETGDGDRTGATLEKVSYDALIKRIADNPSKPKFTVVDAWATWCPPCKENFPHVVEMNKKYGDKGVAVASLSFDDPSEAKAVEAARAFVKEKKANFSNYLLDEEFGTGFDKLSFTTLPAVFIFGPDGKEMKRFTWDDPNNQFTYDEVDKAIETLLAGK
jgi:thiol-disulfide isomerase/thioredoxin